MEEILFVEALNDTDNSDDDMDEAFLLHILHDEEQLGNRGDLYGRFNLDEMFEVECRNHFRFDKNDIERVARGLGIPERITTDDRVSVSGTEGLCIVLKRLAYPNRFVDLEPLFG